MGQLKDYKQTHSPVRNKKNNNQMKITVPNEVRTAINDMPRNKTVKRNAIKVYAALFLKQHLKNNQGYFPVPSTYLMSVNKRYNNILTYFIDKKILDYYKKPYQDDSDIFNTIYKKSYNKEKGICAKYKFLVNVELGTEVEVDMASNKQTRWYEIIENSLIETGFETNIIRDNYGRRVYHPAIREYKNDFKGFYTIDAACSQPRLLYLHLKDKGIVDNKYNQIFEDELDFYSEVVHELQLESRQEAKDLFVHWVNGNGYVPNFKVHYLFPVVSTYLKKVKIGNYKNSGSLLQRKESKIWIDDILNNIPCDFALPIHDCVIVKEKDADAVLNYCQAKYPDLRFKKEKITGRNKNC